MDGSSMSTTDSQRVVGEELRQFVERVERIRAEKKELAEAEKEIMAEAKGRGYMVMAIRQIVKERAQDPDDRAEREAIIDMYRSAMGM